MGFKLKSGNTSSFKTMGGSEKSPAKQKYDLSEATVDGKTKKEILSERNQEYKGVNDGKLFLHGKTKDKDGNIVDIKWAPNPSPHPELLKKDKKKSPAKQYENPSNSKKETPGQYWYKINGKPATKAEYIKYQNKPGGDEPGKQTNHPDVYGRIKNNHGRGPKLNK